MALFSRKSKKKTDGIVLTELDEILGYLDEIYRKRIPLTFVLKGKEYSTDILFIEKKTRSLRIQSGGTNRIPNGADIMVGFSLDKTWWSFASKFALIDDKPHLMIPKMIKHNERRQGPRTTFSPREQVKVTILEGLGSGHGVFGLAKDISPGGMCMQIEKAMYLATEKEVAPSEKLFENGTKLAMVKINRIPGSPQIEIQGIAKRVFKDGKWYLSFQFAKLSKAHQTMIQRFIEPRVLEFRYQKRSLKKRQEMDERQNAVSPPSGSPPKKAAAEQPAPTQETPATKKQAAKKAEAPATSSPTLAPTSGPKIRTLVVGDGLMEHLAFLKGENSPIEVIPGLSPVTIIKILTDNPPQLFLCGPNFKGRSMLDVLERIFSMGVGKNIKIILCSQDMPSKDKIKFKMMKITDEASLPIADPQAFVSMLQEKAKA